MCDLKMDVLQWLQFHSNIHSLYHQIHPIISVVILYLEQLLITIILDLKLFYFNYNDIFYHMLLLQYIF